MTLTKINSLKEQTDKYWDIAQDTGINTNEEAEVVPPCIMCCVLTVGTCSLAKESWGTSVCPVGIRKGAIRLSLPVTIEKVKKLKKMLRLLHFANGEKELGDLISDTMRNG